MSNTRQGLDAIDGAVGSNDGGGFSAEGGATERGYVVAGVFRIIYFFLGEATFGTNEDADVVCFFICRRS